jgi:hypothetical protein
MGNALVKLDDDAKVIGSLFHRARHGIVGSVMHLLECGQRLIAKKEELEHGEFRPWLAANEEILGFGHTTAARLMKKARMLRPTQHLLTDSEALNVSRELWGNAPKRVWSRGGNMEWYTPVEYIDLAREVLGYIDLDPASCEIAQRTVKARHFHTKDDDGLKQKWHGRVWLNPPYANPLMGLFIDKLLEERNAKRVKAAIVLTHNFTDTFWFQKLAMLGQAVCFCRGRIRFLDDDGNEYESPGNGQAFTYFGSDTGRFFDVFSRVGAVLRS